MNAEDTAAFELAFGRILRMGARPTQPGDIEEYERCRAIIMSMRPEAEASYQVNWARDRNKGAQGD